MDDHCFDVWDPERNPWQVERPISRVYPVIDTDIGRDNLENDLPTADLTDI